MIADILGAIGRFIVETLLCDLLFYTGEFLLYAITLGRKKVRWDYYISEKSSTKFVVFSEISTWIGFAFWIGLILLIFRVVT